MSILVHSPGDPTRCYVLYWENFRSPILGIRASSETEAYMITRQIAKMLEIHFKGDEMDEALVDEYATAIPPGIPVLTGNSLSRDYFHAIHVARNRIQGYKNDPNRN